MSTPRPEISALYSRLEEVLGRPHAETLMSHLPPPPSDVATHSDVAQVVTRLDGLDTRLDTVDTRLDHLDTRFDALEIRFDRLETRFDGLETRLDQRLLSFEERVDARLGRFDERLDRMQDLMHTQFKNFWVAGASFMTGLTAVFGIMLAAFG